jgi:large subunit ribosomal protein L2
MALKTFRPLTPTARFKVLPTFEEITKDKPERSLLRVKKRSGGRNNNGRITTRHIGGGHKQKYRVIDFKRIKRGVSAEVVGIEYDPNRTCRIALLQYPDGAKAYILAPTGLNVGDKVTAGEDAEPKVAMRFRSSRSRWARPSTMWN